MVIIAVCALAAFASPDARADYEQVPEHYGESGELLKGALAVAVNTDGSGGVEAGTFYVSIGRNRLLRFSRGAEGEAPQFLEAWGWGVGDNAEEFQRCGPAYAVEPRPAHTFPTCKLPKGIAGGKGGEEAGNFAELLSVAVDQTTGDVYVLNGAVQGTREHHLIEVFSPTGTPISGFGDIGRELPLPSESIAEGPEKLHSHGVQFEGGIAVDGVGDVYVIDRDFPLASGTKRGRVMSFEPEHAGDFEHYVYAGTGRDIIAPTFNASFLRIALVGANRLVAASKGTINEYPTSGGSVPICTVNAVGGQVKGMSANSQTGEVFYFVGASHALHRLGPCNEVTGKFEEAQEPVMPLPETTEMVGLAVNPKLSWGPLRPAGVVYGVVNSIAGILSEGAGVVFAPSKVQGVPPEIVAESALNTTATSSTLQAQIDPKGFATGFSFQYLSRAEYLANSESFEGPNAPRVAPIVPGHIGGGSPSLAAAPVSGLAPDTEYLFRVVATSECKGPLEPACEAQGSPRTFRTYPVTQPGLVDERAYELVSPAQKHGGEVFPADPSTTSCLPRECKPPGLTDIFSVFPMQAVPGGDAVSYMGFPFSPTEGSATFNSYISRRTAAGWQTTAMSPRVLANVSSLAYDESLSSGVITQAVEPQLAEGAPAGYANAYLQNADNPAVLRPLLSSVLFESLEAQSAGSRPYRPAGSLRVDYAGHSADFASQYFEANDSLTFASAFAPEPPDPGSAGRDLYEWRGGNLALVNVLPGNTTVATGAAFVSASPDTHAVSTDGNRVYWQAEGQLYVREGGRTTREVHDAGKFLAASPDGLQALLSDGCLYSLATASCSTDLTQGHGGFLGIAGASATLSHIYFVDTAVLPGKNEREEEAEPTKPNLYSYEAGVGTRFITTLLASDEEAGEELNDWMPAPGRRTAEASPNGRYLAFVSTAQLTGFANVGPCRRANQEAGFLDVPCREVFLYDSATGRLTCPSCNPAGEVPLGNSTLRRIFSVAAKGWLPQPRYLTDQGRLFFDSSDRLSPRDTNGRVEDVYEAEPVGLGSCTRPSGCVSLISPGTGSVDSNFLAMDETGNNVFFTSRERLVPADTDQLIDVYDARVGGGFPGETEVAPSECRGEACQPTVNPPTSSDSGTSNFQGSGNPAAAGKPKQCPKGKVKRKGKCVKKAKKQGKGHGKKAQRTTDVKRGGGK